MLGQYYNQQLAIDRINNQITELEKLKKQIPQQQTPTNLTQNFQIAPANNYAMRFVDTIDDVAREPVYFDTPYFSRDMSVLWIKNVKGDIKIYELNEIIPKDSKDIQIEYLQSQIEELKGMIKNDASTSNVNAKQNTTDTSGDVEPVGEESENVKPSSIQKVSRSKKE